MAGVLAGQVAIVTGAGRGFARDRPHRGDLDKVVADIEAAGGKAVAATADVTDREGVEAAVRAVQAALGPVSLLVNGAGLDTPFGPIGHVDPDEWWSTHAIHVRGPLLFMSAVLPGMLARGQGHIVNIASLGGRVVEPNMSAYAVGKAAEIRLTEHVGAETKGKGIGVFSIEPGTAITSMGASTLNNPEAHRWIPGGIAFLTRVQEEQKDPAVREAVFRRCGDMVVGLLSGRYDALTGRYLEPQDDFDALLKQATAA